MTFVSGSSRSSSSSSTINSIVIIIIIIDSSSINNISELIPASTSAFEPLYVSRYFTSMYCTTFF